MKIDKNNTKSTINKVSVEINFIRFKKKIDLIFLLKLKILIRNLKLFHYIIRIIFRMSNHYKQFYFKRKLVQIII